MMSFAALLLKNDRRLSYEFIVKNRRQPNPSEREAISRAAEVLAKAELVASPDDTPPDDTPDAPAAAAIPIGYRR